MSPQARYPRRDILRLIAASAAAAPTTELVAQEAKGTAGVPELPPTLAAGTPTDPNLMTKHVFWPMVLSQAEMVTVTSLADVILPADEKSPAASTVGVPEFINEWVSAPYEIQQADQQTIRGGLAWLNTETQKRFEKPFAELSAEQKATVCDDLCDVKTAKPEMKIGVTFFDRFRDLCAMGYYTTPEGMKDIGYIGNQPLAEFPGPPPEVLKHLGLA